MKLTVISFFLNPGGTKKHLFLIKLNLAVQTQKATYVSQENKDVEFLRTTCYILRYKNGRKSLNWLSGRGKLMSSTYVLLILSLLTIKQPKSEIHP